MREWFAVYTKYGREADVTKLLQGGGFDAYVPYYYDGSFLFPCYVFAHFEALKHAWMVGYTRGVIRIVGHPEPWPVESEVLEMIRELEKQEPPTVLAPEVGSRVKILGGRFAGLEGIFLERRGEARAIMLLDALNRARTEVDIENIVGV